MRRLGRSENLPACVASTDRNTRWLTARCPVRTQGRKQQQLSLVLSKEYTPRRQMLDFLKIWFFLPLRPAKGHTSPTSEHSPVEQDSDEWCLQKRSGRCKETALPAAKERSTHWRSIHLPLDAAASCRSTTLDDARATSWDVPTADGRSTTPSTPWNPIARASCNHSAESLPFSIEATRLTSKMSSTRRYTRESHV